MKSVRFERLLASTALGLALALSVYPAGAQQAEQPKIDAAVPMPDTSLPPPLTAKDIATPEAAKSEPAQAATPAPAAEPVQNATAPAAEPAKAEPVQNATAPAAEPAKAEPVQNATAPATEPTKAETPAVTADNALTEKLRELVTGKQLDRLVSRKADRAGIESFYAARDYAPIWVTNGAPAARTGSAIAYLGRADEVGLDASEYPTPDFKSATTPEALAEAELKLTASVLTFARHAQTGRIHPTRVAGDISFNPVAPEPADVLAKLAADDDAARALDSYNPPQAEFKALRAKLADLRKTGGQIAKPDSKKPTVRISDGKILRPGMSDTRVVALRQRLEISGDKDSPVYDENVVNAVKAFQLTADLNADGMLGPNTVSALNGEMHAVRRPSANPIDTIIVNMERWRWFPRELGNPHVIVNVPDYSLTLWNDGKVYWHTKIVVGKPSQATPMISAEMKFITVNPTWNVPPSIIENEYLPALQEDPNALERIGLKITQNADGTVRIYQPPGEGNALGRLRFNFPNKFLVYQHDTPDKHLFAKEKRAFSHGCMRVQNPLTYAEKLLSLAMPNERYTEARLEKMFGGNEININFPKPIWVHLTYQTAFVDHDGKLQLRDDVYGRDARMIAILKGSERKIAELPMDRPPNTSSKPVRMPVGMYSGRDRGYRYDGGYRYDDGPYYRGPGFFDMLFGGGYREEAYRPRRNLGAQMNNNGRYTR